MDGGDEPFRTNISKLTHHSAWELEADLGDCRHLTEICKRHLAGHSCLLNNFNFILASFSWQATDENFDAVFPSFFTDIFFIVPRYIMETFRAGCISDG